MHRRGITCLLLVLMLAGCGGTSGPGAADTPSPTPAAPAQGISAEETVTQALDAITARDQTALTALIDEGLGESLRPIRASEIIRDWFNRASEAQVPSALGAVQEKQVQSAETQGALTVVPVVVTYARGTTRWEFNLRQTDQGWRITEVYNRITESRAP